MAEPPPIIPDREAVAKLEIGHTAISRAMASVLTGCFLLAIFAVPLAQAVWELRSGSPKVIEIINLFSKAAAAYQSDGEQTLWDRVFAANGALLRGIGDYEKQLEDTSFMAQFFIPRMQALTSRYVGLGNEQVYLGRDGWLFYRPEVDYVTGAPFLDANFQKRRARCGDASAGAAIQPDPVLAIVDFQRQLANRGVHLIVLPAPVKPVIEPDRLSAAYPLPISEPVQNPSYTAFLDALTEAGVDWLDVSQALLDLRKQTGEDSFLVTDTHWAPGAMTEAAALLAAKVRGYLPQGVAVEIQRGEETVEGPGDIAAMLKLPAGSTLYPKQKVTLQPVSMGDGKPWKPDPSSPALLLGDSFSNIYSLGAMGWGASAGFAEQLSASLGVSVDAILRNDAGAFATREMLVRDLAQGRDRLAGKKVLIWEFAMRELAVGDWKILPLPEIAALATEIRGDFFVPKAGPVQVEGVVEAVSTFPRPGEVPYSDHIFSVILSGIRGDGVPEGARAVVYLWSMRKNVLTPASAWQQGDHVTLNLQDWNDVAPEYERFNRSEPEDSDLQLEMPAWGEPHP